MKESSRFFCLLGALALLLGAVGAGLTLATPDIPIFGPAWGFRGYDLLPTAVFSVVGLLITVRRPDNTVGRLLILIGLTLGIQAAGVPYLQAVGQGGPGADAVEWVTRWVWVPGLAAMVLLLLLFPDGHPLSRRWLAIARLVVALGVVTSAAWALAAPDPAAATPEDPYGLGASAWAPVAEAGTALIAAGGVAAILAMALRLRRGRGVERQQVSWVAMAGLVVALCFALMLAAARADPPIARTTQVLSILAFLLLPASIAVAILRHRLYDIELVVRRTLVYGALTGVLGAVYAAAVLVLQMLLAQIAGGGSLAVAASTLAVVALFQPVRRRIQSIVDRRFYRSRYDAARALEAFGAGLRQQVDLGRVRRDVVAVVEETLQPVTAWVWLRPTRRDGGSA